MNLENSLWYNLAIVQAQSSDACKSEIFGYMMILMCLNIYHAEIIIITMLIYI